MIDSIVSRLRATGLAQVMRADSVGMTDVSAGPIIGDLIAPQVSDRVYQLVLPERPTAPNAVYQLVGSRRDEADGLPVLRSDSVIVTLRDNTLAGLVSVVDDVRAALLAYTVAGSAGAIDITDQALDFEPDQKQYRAHLELSVTHLAAASQSLPAAFVYPASASAAPSAYDNHTRQRVENIVSVLLVSESRLLQVARDYMATLIGEDVSVPVPAGSFEVGVDSWAGLYQRSPIEYVGGELVLHTGHLTLWRERYRVTSYRTE